MTNKCPKGYGYNGRLKTCIKKKYNITVDNARAGTYNQSEQYPHYDWVLEEYPDQKTAIKKARSFKQKYVKVWESIGVKQEDKKIVWTKKCPNNQALYGDEITGACVDKNRLEDWKNIKQLKKNKNRSSKDYRRYHSTKLLMDSVRGGVALRKMAHEAGNLYGGRFIVDTGKEAFR
jgi:hypothetical protein